MPLQAPLYSNQSAGNEAQRVESNLNQQNNMEISILTIVPFILSGISKFPKIADLYPGLIDTMSMTEALAGSSCVEPVPVGAGVRLIA